jgi:hypothetical protein
MSWGLGRKTNTPITLANIRAKQSLSSSKVHKFTKRNIEKLPNVAEPK